MNVSAKRRGGATKTVRLLCSIDDQDHSWRAAFVGIDLAKRLSAELILCMINFAILPSSRGPKVYRWTDSYIQEVLNEGVSRARGLDLWDVRRVTMQANSVADGIIACADLFEADYVIIGTRGRSNFMEILSGSISRKVSAKANCPVLVVRRVRGEPTMLSKRRILERVLLSFIARVSRRDL